MPRARLRHRRAVRHGRLQEQVKLAGQSSDQLGEQYLIGDVEYLDVLSAITGQQSLQRQLLSAQLELVLIRVSLYLALAGGFDVNERSFPYLEDMVQVEQLINSQDSNDTEAPPEPESLDDTEEDPAEQPSDE